MTRVTIRVETEAGEVEVSEESLRHTWSGREIEPLDSLLERALAKVHGAYQITSVDLIAPMDGGDGVRLSDTNRALIHKAYDDGEGGTLTITASDTPGYFTGMYDGDEVMKGTEVNGVLYSICPNSGGGLLSLLIGAELTDGMTQGVTFKSNAEARDHIRWITAK